MEKLNPQIEESWKKVLKNEFESTYFKLLKDFLVEEKKKYRIFPLGKNIFTAFNLTPFNEVKVVILGQDPYHGDNQAHGLCFSVPDDMKLPPSLVNIYKEIEDDLGIKMPPRGNLTSWAQQGVLLLNATLTVRAYQAGSHQKKGWEIFTDSVIKNISDKKEGIVFILWGNYAQAKIPLIDTAKHYILKAAHPSPLSAYNGFFGCKHFSQTNKLLLQKGKLPVNWHINAQQENILF